MKNRLEMKILAIENKREQEISHTDRHIGKKKEKKKKKFQRILLSVNYIWFYVHVVHVLCTVHM